MSRSGPTDRPATRSAARKIEGAIQVKKGELCIFMNQDPNPERNDGFGAPTWMGMILDDEPELKGTNVHWYGCFNYGTMTNDPSGRWQTLGS